MLHIAIADTGYASYDIEQEHAERIGASLVIRQCRSEDEVIELARDAHGLMVRNRPVTRRVIRELERCLVIVRYGIGVDNIDLAAATEHGIVVANVAGFGTHEVAEHAIALLLACARRILIHDRAVREGAWDIAAAEPVHRVTGSTLGLVGYGANARAVHDKLAGFGLRTMAYDPYVAADEVRARGAEPVELETLLREADLISLHAVLTPQSRHMIDAAALALVKPTAVLVNTARGALVDTPALIAALQEGRLAAAGLDVHEEEPLPRKHPIRTVERTILVDHAGWYSEESMTALHRGAIEAVAAVLSGERPASVVNPEVYDRGIRATLPD